MTERQAFLLAGGLHAGLLAALSLGLADALPKLAPEPDVTPIEFIEIADVAARPEPPRPTMEAAPREEGLPPPPEPVSLAPPAPPAVAPAPAPAPTVADTSPQDRIAAAEPRPQPAARERPPAREPSRFDAGQMAALIDRSRPEAPLRTRETDPSARTAEAPAPRQARLSPIQAATLEQAIRAQIAPCWNPPIGGADVAQMTAVLRIRLNRDGSVATPPEFVSQTGASAGNQAYARAFVESARRAVLRCAPLQLPDDLFVHWREFELNFDPRLMT